jgi:hypothetical protein
MNPVHVTDHKAIVAQGGRVFQSLLNAQEEVGPLLGELLKTGFWVWRASAWISTPSRSSSPSSCRSTARSWFVPVA